MVVLYAAVLNWFVTTILVESSLFEPIRGWIVRESLHVTARGERHKVANKHWYVWPEDATEEEVAAGVPYHWGNWGKLAQLVTCQLCTRTWVGFAEAFVFGGPFTGQWHQYLSNGLLYAGLGHLIFEARSRLALILPENPDAH